MRSLRRADARAEDHLGGAGAHHEALHRPNKSSASEPSSLCAEV